MTPSLTAQGAEACLTSESKWDAAHPSCDSPSTSRRCRIPHGAAPLVQAMPVWAVETQRALSRNCRDARAYGHRTTAMHDNECTPLHYTDYIKDNLRLGGHKTTDLLQARLLLLIVGSDCVACVRLCKQAVDHPATKTYFSAHASASKLFRQRSFKQKCFSKRAVNNLELAYFDKHALELEQTHLRKSSLEPTSLSKNLF